MSRWSRYDTDEERLPQGFERVGYDADSQTYTFRDKSDGSLWEGPEGAQYGELRQITAGGRTSNDGGETAPFLSHEQVERGDRNSWRYILPFFLLIGLILLGVWQLLKPEKQVSIACGNGARVYIISRGDTCWDIAKAHHMNVDWLKEMNVNHDLDCDHLVPGDAICVH